MEQQLRERLEWAHEAVGRYSWNFRIPDTDPRLLVTIKRKLYKKLMKHPDLWEVHKNGNIAMNCTANVAPKALAVADSIIQDLVSRYKEQGVFIEEADKLSVL